MTECRRIESLLPPYVDGEATPDEVRQIESHLGVVRCRARRRSPRANARRVILRARASAIWPRQRHPGCEPGSSPRCSPREQPSLGWRGRLTAFAAAAAVLVLLITAFEFVPSQSNVLFAAQLAIDHVRCFVAEQLGTMSAADASELERQYRERLRMGRSMSRRRAMRSASRWWLHGAVRSGLAITLTCCIGPAIAMCPFM